MTHLRANYGGSPFVFHQNNFHCRSDFWVESVRSVGDPNDISISTISLFWFNSFTGNMSQYSSNVPNYAGTFSSFIITPPGEATFYTLTNYEGLSICTKPNNGSPTHWTEEITELGIEPGDIKSMKLGCDSTNIHYSSPVSTPDEKIIYKRV